MIQTVEIRGKILVCVLRSRKEQSHHSTSATWVWCLWIGNRLCDSPDFIICHKHIHQNKIRVWNYFNENHCMGGFIDKNSTEWSPKIHLKLLICMSSVEEENVSGNSFLIWGFWAALVRDLEIPLGLDKC